jgi:hypothetical protein
MLAESSAVSHRRMAVIDDDGADYDVLHGSTLAADRRPEQPDREDHVEQRAQEGPRPPQASTAVGEHPQPKYRSTAGAAERRPTHGEVATARSSPTRLDSVGGGVGQRNDSGDTRNPAAATPTNTAPSRSRTTSMSRAAASNRVTMPAGLTTCGDGAALTALPVPLACGAAHGRRRPPARHRPASPRPGWCAPRRRTAPRSTHARSPGDRSRR